MRTTTVVPVLVFYASASVVAAYDESPWQPPVSYDYYHIDLGELGGGHQHGVPVPDYGAPNKGPVVPRDVVVDVINDLGIKILAIHNEHNENNIAISPYGAFSVLAALSEGLQGDAAHEILQATHIPKDKHVIRVGLRDVHRHLKSYFIPEEGFLAGLTLNLNNVTLRSEYEDVLHFYGFDYSSFNNALYPEPLTTKKPSTVEGTTLETGLGVSEDTTTEAPTTTIDGILSRAGGPSTSETSTTEPPPSPPSSTTAILTTPTDMMESTINSTTSTEATIEGKEDSTSITTPPPTTTSQREDTTTASSVATVTAITGTTIATTEDKVTEATTTTISSEASIITTSTGAAIETTTTAPLVPEQAISEIMTSTTAQTVITSASPTLEQATEAMTSKSSETIMTTVAPETPSTQDTTTMMTVGNTMRTTRQVTDVASDDPDNRLLTTTEVTRIATDDEMTDDVVGVNTTEPGLIVEVTPTTITTTVAVEAEYGEGTTSDVFISTTTTNDDSDDLTYSNYYDATTTPPPPPPPLAYADDSDAMEQTITETLKRKARSVVDYVIARFYDEHHTYVPLPLPRQHQYVPQEPLTFAVYGKFRESGVNLMKYDTVLPYFFVPNLSALALSFPLDSSKYYLLLLLPLRDDGVDQLICDLRLHGNMRYVIDNLRLTHVIATIPSFMLKGYVTLTPALQRLGIRKIFEPRQADFSPMTNVTDIYVTNIEQAVTVTIRNYLDPSAERYKNFRRYPPVHFKADHPFLYFVIDSELHVALMVGKVINPLNARIR